MTVTVSNFQTVSLPDGKPLATVGDSGELTLWPAGVGVGPTITMSIHDWLSLRNSADNALSTAPARLDRYSACEGFQPWPTGGDE